MRRFLALVAAFITLTGMAGQGPCVEVSSKLESQFICYLKGFKDGLFQFEMLNGDSRTERAENIASMKFLKGPPPPPQRDERRRPPPEDGPGRGPEGRGPDGERRPPPRDDDGFGPPPPPPPKRRRRPDPDDPGLVRLRGLAERDREGTLSATEWEELHGLRQRFKLFPPHSTYRFRLEAARSAARSAQQHGKLDVHVQQYQRRLSDADMDDDAGDARLMLFASYMLAEGGNLPEIRKKLKRDIETIRDPGVRERLQRRPDDLDEATSVLRQTEKSGSEK